MSCVVELLPCARSGGAVLCSRPSDAPLLPAPQMLQNGEEYGKEGRTSLVSIPHLGFG